MISGNGQIEFGIDSLMPGYHHGAELLEALIDSMDERIRTVPAEYHLHSCVGVEDGEHVDQSQQRGHMVGDYQYCAFRADRIPVPRL